MNMEVKYPMSQLEKLMARQQKDLPIYEIVKTCIKGARYHCTVRADGVEGIGIGSTKKNAKTEAATHALRLLGYFNADEMVSLIPRKVQSNVVLNSVLSYNAVGKLNECMVQKKLPNPTYNECGMNSNDLFGFQCRFLTYVSEGYASTKKAAKQLAAHNMLKQIDVQPSSVDRVDVTNNEVLKEVAECSTRFERFMPFCRNSNETMKQNETPVLVDNVSQKGFPNIKIEVFANSKEQLMQTVDEICEALKHTTLSYTINVINTNPHVLVLKFENEHNVIGSKYKEACFNLLRCGLKVIDS